MYTDITSMTGPPWDVKASLMGVSGEHIIQRLNRDSSPLFLTNHQQASPCFGVLDCQR